jgi:hypothetical protein
MTLGAIVGPICFCIRGTDCQRRRYYEANSKYSDVFHIGYSTVLD